MAETVRIEISTGNAAFDDQPATEIARILRELAATLERDGLAPAALRDINGNKVGRVTITKDRR